MRRPMRRVMMAMLLGALAMPAAAQLLPGLGGGNALGGLPGGLLGQGGALGSVGGGLGAVGGLVGSGTPADLLALRRDRLRALIHDNRATLDADAEGNPVRRDEVVLSGGDPARALAAGFTIARRETIDGIGLAIVVLTPPKGLSARKALARLATLDPGGAYTLNSVYEPAFAALDPAGGAVAGGGGGAAAMGLIDGGVGNHPAFAAATIEQRGFAGPPQPTGHGTAVASLMVGRAGAFSGVVPGGRLMVADVYGGAPANGSAEAIVRAMGWLATGGVRVVNISLVGAANPLLAAGVRALQARGIAVVAAVGNDGPAAPPQYPASYSGVIAVTAIDAKGRVLPEAGRAAHLDFAAPGADMVGAAPGGGWEVLRGTSFAAPLVAASLARAGSVEALATKPGGKTGRGIVCAACATPPRAVGLR